MATAPKTTTPKTSAAKEESTNPRLDMLKAQAAILGVEYREDVTENALRKLLLDALNQADTGETITNAERKKVAEDSTKLVRCIVSPNNPQQKEYQGQLFSVGNSVIGYISKFVLFNAEYHVPQIILDHIQDQQMQYFVNKKVGKNTVRESKLRPAYTVSILPALTKEELEELAKNQLARTAIAD